MDVARDDADLGLVHAGEPGAVGTDQARAASAEHVVDAQHVEGGNALGDADHQRDVRVGCLQHRVRRECGRHEDACRVGPGLLDRLRDGVVYRHAPVERGLPALAGRDAGHDVRAVLEHGGRVKLTLATGDPLDQEPRVAVDEDAHAVPPAAATAFAAASSSESAVMRFASARIGFASSELVPTMRTTMGTSRVRRERASTMPRATSSPRVMPPKMLIRIAFTFGSSRMILKAAATRSALAPPPMSRKFAGSPPASLTRSMVVMASPAPLTMQPIDPSSLMKLMPASRAAISDGSSSLRSRIASRSGWRGSAESSSTILASSASN